MVQKLNHRQKRGLLIALVVLVLVAGWRWRAGQLAQAPAAETTVTGATARPQADTRIELNAADTTALQTVKGIGPAIARRIVRYRGIIGGFTSTEQLLKVYGITPENFIRIEEQVFADTTTAAFATLKAGKYQQQSRPSFAYSPRPRRNYAPPANSSATVPPSDPAPGSNLQSQAAAPASPSKAVLAPIDINQADSSDLVAISGIGPATARNILKYRSLIWYFDNLDQLSEVWGVRPENLERMKPHLSVSDSKNKMPHLEINSMTVDEMGRHKYFGYKEARILVAYREMHGPFRDFSDVQRVQGIAPEKLDKLRPYFLY